MQDNVPVLDKSHITKQYSENRHILAYLVVAFFAFISYANVLHGEFVLDDVAFYVNNSALTADHDITRFFFTSVWKHSILQRQTDPLYRPLFMVVMWVNQMLIGSNVVAHHLFNVGLHVLATIMTLRLLSRLLPAAGLLPQFAGALLFAVHPVHVETVSWISAFGHVLATSLLLGAMLCYLRHLEDTALKWLTCALTMFALALLSIEVAVAFPVIISAYEYLRFRKIHSCRIASFWVILVLYFVVRKLVLGQMAPLNIGSLTAWATAYSFASAYIEYLFVPWPQFVYLMTPVNGIVSPTGGILTIAFVVGVTIIVRRQVPEKQVMLFSLFWIVFAMATPVIAALNAHPMFAIRSLYLSSVGISIFTAWIFTAAQPKKRPLAVVLFGLLVALAVPVTLAANRDWLNNQVVYEKIFSVTPESSGVAVKLADIYENLGKEQVAERTLLTAVAHAPDDKSLVSLYERLGLMYGIKGDAVRSEKYYREVLKLSPEKSSAWVGLGNIALMHGEMQAALKYYLRAVELDPDNNEANYDVALVYQKLGNLPLAETYLRRYQIPGKLNK